MSQLKRIVSRLVAAVAMMCLSLSVYAQPCPPVNPVLGPDLVCPGSQTVYTVSLDNSPTSTYTWTLFGTGGQILGSNTGTSVTIEWMNDNGGPYTLRCTEQVMNCLMFNDLDITIADDVARGRFNCFSEISIPLDHQCEKLIEPSHLLTTGAPACDNSFRVELSINGDIPVPNPVTEDYIGQIISAEVIHNASGRSCVSLVTVKDGSAPVLTCTNDTTLCNDINAWDPFHESFKRPVAIDNCDDTVDVESQGYEWIQVFGDPDIDAYIIRSWAATDKVGNRSVCNDTIFMRRIIFDEIVCPSDTVISCESETFDLNDPSTSGVPTFEGLPIYSEKSYCDFKIKYEDEILPGCGDTYKVHRYWYLSQVTSDAVNEDTCHQIIELVDTTGPFATFDDTKVKMEVHDDVFGLPADKVYNTVHLPTLDYDCLAFGYLPQPTVFDNCSVQDSIIVDFIWDNGRINYLNGEVSHEDLRFENLPRGKHIITLKLRDQCHNTSFDTLVAVAEDIKPPYLVVDKEPVVTLGAYSDVTWIDISVFDEGTWDNCELLTIVGRRADWQSSCGYSADSMVASRVRNHYDNFYQWWTEDNDSLCHQLIPYGYSDQIPFCCTDACLGNKVTLEIIAIDVHCNLSKIWVDVEVEDKSAPQVQSPLPDLEISCWAYNQYYRQSVKNGDFSVFGIYEPSQSDGYSHEPTYTIIKDRNCYRRSPDNFYTMVEDTILNGQIIENCDLKIDETQKVFFEDCGVGWIERKFVFKGACNVSKGDSTYITQKISIINDCPLHESEINWPNKDTTIYSCNYQDIETEAPTIKFPDECRQIGIHHKDDVVSTLYNADSTCFKIIRTWAVIDWCRQSEPYHSEWIGSQDFHYYEFEQVIYIKNPNPPEIKNCDIDTVCIGQYCTGTLNHEIQISDDCTAEEDLIVSWALYEKNDYGFLPEAKGEGVHASAEHLSVGEYKLVWTVTDACNNTSICTDYFQVKDCVKPTPICVTSTSLRLIPLDLDRDGLVDTAIAELWAEELDVSSHDNCDGEIQFLIRRSGTGKVDDRGNLLPPDSNAKKLDFSCEDIGVYNAEFWVIDGSGNADFCIVNLHVQAPVEGCDGNLGRVAGAVSSISLAGLEDVVLSLAKENGEKFESTSQSDGLYSFDPYRMDGTRHVLTASIKDDNIIAGISTQDVIKIAKHLRSVDRLEDGYSMVAADANGDGKISVGDIVAIRKLLLGRIDSFDVPAWRFLNVEMSSESDLTLNESEHLMNFVGVKIGDVNGDFTDDVNGASRSQDRESLLYEDIALEAGHVYQVEFESLNPYLLEGLQLELNYSGFSIEEVDILDDDFDIDYKLTDQKLLISAYSKSYRPINRKVGIMLTVRSHVSGIMLSDVIALSSKRINSELYIEGMAPSLALKAHGQNLPMQLNVHSYPNPFTSSAIMKISSDQAIIGRMEVVDALGRLVLLRNFDSISGSVEMSIDASELESYGIYYCNFYTSVANRTVKLIFSP